MTKENEEKRQKGSDLVEISRTDLESLTKRLEKLESGSLIDLDEPKQHFVSVRLLDGKPINRLYNVRKSGIDPVTKDEIMSCKAEVVGENGKIDAVDADYLDIIRNAESVRCELLKTIEKDVSTVHGKVAAQMEQSYNMVPTGVMVPLKVRTVETKFVVRTPDGRELTLDTVNI